MTVQGPKCVSAALAASLVLLGAARLVAQERPLFQWSGRVDREVTLVMRGGSLQPRADRRESLAGSASRVLSTLPREEGLVSVRVERGRGAVDIVEQPTAANDFTTVIRIRDEAPGAFDYRIAATWAAPGDAGRSGDRGRHLGKSEGDRGRHLGQIAGNRGRDDARDERKGDRRDDERRGRDARGGEDVVTRVASTDGRGVLTWSGSVDDQVEILIQGGDFRYTGVRGQGTRNVRARLSGELPRREVQVSVNKREGRGQVIVVRQPNAANGYTAIVRVRDASAGMGYYDFDVSW